MFHVRSSIAPRLFSGPDAPDRCLAPEIELPTGDPSIDDLVANMDATGLTTRAFLLDEPPLPPTVLVSVVERGVEPPMVHMGLGCSISPAHALLRSLTEAVQSRVIDIQAAREDMLRPHDPPNKMGEHGRRPSELPRNHWYIDLPARKIKLSDTADRSSDDLAKDLRSVLDALDSYEIRNVIAVELAPADLPISVVRAIVPGLESLMFSNYLGRRARAALNPFAVT
jgi:ribosomal protein S12 methylthiotransferase accessory factor